MTFKDAYEASHPGVTIEMVDLGSTDYMTVLATELSGSGSDFDVVTVKDVPGYATLVQKGSILSLDDYISKDGVDLSKYAGVTDQVTVDGSCMSCPSEMTSGYCSITRICLMPRVLLILPTI